MIPSSSSGGVLRRLEGPRASTGGRRRGSVAAQHASAAHVALDDRRNAAGVLSAVAPAKNNGNWLAGLGEWV